MVTIRKCIKVFTVIKITSHSAPKTMSHDSSRIEVANIVMKIPFYYNTHTKRNVTHCFILLTLIHVKKVNTNCSIQFTVIRMTDLKNIIMSGLIK